LAATMSASYPDAELMYEIEYTPKVKLELKKGPTGGGCGQLQPTNKNISKQGDQLIALFYLLLKSD
jgi:hypothetical protein